ARYSARSGSTPLSSGSASACRTTPARPSIGPGPSVDSDMVYRVRAPLSHQHQLSRIASLAREQTEKSINTIIGIRDQEANPPAVRLAAAIELLNRGWGRAKEVDFTEASEHERERTLKIVREYVHAHETREEILAAEEPLLIEWRGVRDANLSTRTCQAVPRGDAF